MAIEIGGLVILTVASLVVGSLELAAAFSGLGFNQLLNKLNQLLGTFTFRIAIGVILVSAGLAGLAFLYRTWRIFRYSSYDRYRYEGDDTYLGGGNASPASYELREKARRWLGEIRYQLTYTSGWSGSLKVPIAEASVNSSQQAQERQQTLPSVILGYRRLAEAATAEGITLFIGIDELDKIGSDEEAELFLNEIKAIFGINGCFYLVSVSDNAMSSFERRGLPFRDVFDSTFDEIVRIERFRYAQSRQLIKRRTIMPEPFSALCHCVSGGLPRDLIRAARTLYRLNSEAGLDGSLAGLVRAFIEEDLYAKTAATWVELARIESEPAVTPFKYWLKRVTEARLDGDDLYRTARDFWVESQGWGDTTAERPRNGESTDLDHKNRSQLNSLGLEINTYRYLAGTILQFFGSQPSDSELRAAAGPRAGDASFEMLAEARLLFARGPLLAWNLISDFRAAHDLQSLDQPNPYWLPAAAASTHTAGIASPGGPGGPRAKTPTENGH